MGKLRQQAEEQEKQLKSQEAELSRKKQELENLKSEETNLRKERENLKAEIEIATKSTLESQELIKEVRCFVCHEKVLIARRYVVEHICLPVNVDWHFECSIL